MIEGGAELRGRIAGAAGGAAGVAGRMSGVLKCRRCYDDTAVAGVIGCEEIVRMCPGTELSAREIDDDEGDAGVEEAEVNWP